MRANYPKGMGGAQNMNAMLQQAQKMQEDMAALQEELDAREYDVSAGGGVVRSLSGAEQIGQISRSVRFWQTGQGCTCFFASRMALENSSASSMGRLSTWKASLCAVLPPMPGSFAN